MKIKLLISLCWITSACTYSAEFSAGSTGALGDVHITSNTTADLPPDGILHVKSLVIDSGRILTFRQNALNTPVYILAQETVTIEGTIDVSGGAGSGVSPGGSGPGGFWGGFGGYGNSDHTQGGAGLGPGAGFKNGDPHTMSAAFSSDVMNNHRTYGNALLTPLIGGSGGAGTDGNPGQGGGGGGGAILIAADTSITLNGTIYARGGNGAGAGSGGAVRLVSPIITGRGSFSVDGGYSYYGYYASPGRVRIDCVDRYAFRNLNFAGKMTQGSQMFVFPPTQRRLDIIHAAGKDIPAPATSAIQVTLPAGSDTNQVVKIAASGFSSNAPISVVVTPENGPFTSYNADITVDAQGKGEVTVPIVLSIGNISQIHAWTR